MKRIIAIATAAAALPQDAFAIYDADLKRVVELGEFTVFVGGDSSTENGAVVKLP